MNYIFAIAKYRRHSSQLCESHLTTKITKDTKGSDNYNSALRPKAFGLSPEGFRPNFVPFVVIDPFFLAEQSRLLTHVPSHQPVSETIREACTRRRDTAGDNL